ncbi:hypothetical protein CSUI_004645 [Cystoisospora suis]|uniref:Uncharacterized protein n=1 Tax=Cystoisospora suis TaxID=483139 RepID=A0A2C6L0A8_9APIC|nr:hypothetical protein CSUI_004645 [Cystoisospora suis]
MPLPADTINRTNVVARLNVREEEFESFSAKQRKDLPA